MYTHVYDVHLYWLLSWEDGLQTDQAPGSASSWGKSFLFQGRDFWVEKSYRLRLEPGHRKWVWPFPPPRKCAAPAAVTDCWPFLGRSFPGLHRARVRAHPSGGAYGWKGGQRRSKLPCAGSQGWRPLSPTPAISPIGPSSCGANVNTWSW